jgi:hypothetical protein
MSTAKAKPTAADRLRRGGPVEQPHAGRSVSGGVRVKPVRVTVDLDPGDYDVLRDFAHSERMTHTDILRALVKLLDDDSVSQQVRKSVGQ